VIGLAAQRARALAGERKVALYYVSEALNAGDLEEARRLLENWIRKKPEDAAALSMLAQVAAQGQQFEEAARLAETAAGLDPSPERLAFLVSSLQMAFDPALALSHIERMPEHLRSALDIRALQAMLVGDLGDQERELRIYEELIQSHGNKPSLWMNYGTALKLAGRTDEAVAAVRRAIEIVPSSGEAYWALANFKNYRFSDEEISAMEKALERAPGEIQASNFHFALGVAFEQRGSYEKAFAHFDTGNRLRTTRIPAELMFVTPLVDSAIESLTPALFESRGGDGYPSDEPIFVLGLHRSGSTLVEQILASHPMIEGTSELKIMPKLFMRLQQRALESGRSIFDEMQQLDAQALHDLGAEYMERTRPYRRDAGSKFVDKLPGNWLQIGLIRLALPNAKIIDARRHPMSCGFSNFKQNYATGMSFSYSLESIGALYRDYLRLMEHMDRVQPGAIHRVVNERLIEDVEGEVRRLLDFVGVPFDPACLEFHRNKRAVRTPSAEQVRQPVNRQGVDLWRHYEPWLGPLKQALGPALTEWDKPANA
jgi:tetratricopeptide (TPR) repeat protein